MNYPAILYLETSQKFKSRYGTNIFLQRSEISQSAIFNYVYSISKWQKLAKVAQWCKKMDKHNTAKVS